MGNAAPCCLATPDTTTCLRERSSVIYPAKPQVEAALNTITSASEVQTLSRRSFRRFSSLRIFTWKTEGSHNDITVHSGDGKTSVSINIDQQILNKYMVQSLVGKGSFSSVLNVVCKDSGTVYAMKVIEKSMGQRIVTWETELAVLKRVRHPNIVYLHEVLLTKKQAYFILQFAAGGDLASKVMNDGSLGEQRSRELTVMILGALEYMHGHGITHRDLKLENCLFLTDQPDSLLVVSDFGLAHMTMDGQPNGAGMDATCGTAEYMSPEMLRGELYSSLVDLWALGIIVFAILSGKLPFKAPNRIQLHKNILNGLYSFQSEEFNNVSDDAKNFIQVLLCVDTSQRLTANKAKCHSWIVSDSLSIH